MPRRRDPWLDNAKTVLVVLVVVGHAVVLMPSGEVKSHAYDFVYYFHMPAFVLLTGYLSRSFTWSRKGFVSLVTTLAVPYVLFELLMALWRVHVVDQVSSLEVLSPLWLNPHWPMWYLVVLIMWRLATPVLKAHWVMVPASVGVSLLAGAVDLELFDLNRALGLLPFFVVGLHLPARALAVVRARGTGLAGLAVLAGLWWLAGRTDDLWSTQWLYYRASYDSLGAGVAEGAEIRLQLIGLALLGTFAVLSLVPRRRSAVTHVGAYTMGVYLLHGFPVRWVEAQGYAEWMPGDGWASLGITVALAVGLALLLGWRPLAARALWLVDPVNTFTSWREDRRSARRPQAPTSA
ncbi:acyltransferase family protein [Nocardioides solisilvae]|uniref:acyltransferase family protein n=1 Tax=Nocardioides solisilvae TaxID=1542435 RepID=UPI0013A5899F|nr:acyltransferase family protein [Nocardioides solisilvae]